MRIVFAGTPDFAVPTLGAIANSGHSVVGVLTQPDRPAGRGRRLQASPVKRCAQQFNIPVLQPESLKHGSMHDEIAAWQPDIMVVVAYGLLLPQAVLDIPALACINVHASLLPRWRGAAPIQRAILAGDRETGISIMKMELGLDTGPVLVQRSCPLDELDTASILHDRLADLGANTLLDALTNLETKLASAAAQDDTQACYANKITRGEARLDWTKPAATLQREVLAWNSWPVAFTDIDGVPMRIWSAEVTAAQAAAVPGQVQVSESAGVVVGTGAGRLRLLEIQFAGGKRMPASEAARGRDLHGRQLGETIHG